MISFLRKLIGSMAVILAGTLSVAAQNSLVLQVPEVVSVGEYVSVAYVATSTDGRVTDFSLNSSAFDGMDGLQLVAGPVASTQVSQQWVNGKHTSSRSLTNTFTVIMNKPGKYTMPAASVKIGGQTYTCAAVTVEALEGQQAQSAASSGGELFLTMTVDKRKVVMGEPVVLTIKLYKQATDISNFEDMRFPTFSGFWSQDLEAPRNIQFRRENYKGKLYEAALLRSYVLIPQQTGTITIDPAELVCLVRVRNQNNRQRSIFDDFFEGYQTVRRRAVSTPLEIEVSPLPSNAPASFTGAVGSYRMTAAFDRDSLTAHEASSLRVTVTGTGNINLLEAPKVKLPNDFETYDMRKTDNITAGSSGNTGSVTFEYPFIPRVPGTYSIPPVEFTYYDLRTGKYRTLTSDPLNLAVKKSENEQGATVVSPGVNKQDVKDLASDIRYIATSPASLTKGRLLMADTWCIYGVPAILILVTSVMWMLLRRIEIRRGDVAGTRNRKALKVAKARLKQAQSSLVQKNHQVFYEELYKALTGFLSDKFTLPALDMSRDRIREILEARGKEEALIQKLFEVLDACEYARYAPSEGVQAMEKHYDQAMEVISQIES